MKTSSAKNKGRTLQKSFRDVLRYIGLDYGLVDDDVHSRGMGQSGEDIILTPAARKVFGDMRVEAKNRETLNVVSTFWDHAKKYPGSWPVLVHKKNHTEPLVTLKMQDFAILLKGYLAFGKTKTKHKDVTDSNT